MNCTSAGTAAQAVAVGLPISARATSSMTAFGYIYDANTNTIYNLTGYTATGTTLQFYMKTLAILTGLFVAVWIWIWA
jgi:hypothetical protein